MFHRDIAFIWYSVNSRIQIDFWVLLTMTRSGVWQVGIISGGIAQDCWRRSEIISMSVELISFLMNVSIDDSTLSCLQVYMPCSSMYG